MLTLTGVEAWTQSVFCLGCDYGREAMFNTNQPTSQLLQAIRFLSCT